VIFKKEYDSWFKKIGCVYGIDHAMDVYGMLSDNEIGSASLVELKFVLEEFQRIWNKEYGYRRCFPYPRQF
jgi:hypothetical protein